MRPIGARSAWLTALLAGMILISVASIAVTLGEIDLLDRVQRGGSFTEEEVLASDARVGLVGIVFLLGYLITGIVWCTWQYRAQKNLEVASVEGLEFTPGWAAGWWFVPIANLWKPFGSVRELWKASDPDTERIGWRSVPTWWVIGLWWAAWLLSNAIGRVVFGAYRDGDTIDDLIAADRWSIASDVLTIVAAVLAITVVRAIAERQARLVHVIMTPPRAAFEGLPPPPPPPEAPPPPAS